jgi:LmbE family N-acetylglucosaminyl deacetylase
MEVTWEAVREQWHNGPMDLFLSPHADDVCFSLGGMLARTGGGILITVFTRSCFAPGLTIACEDTSVREQIVTPIRESEDQAFCERVDMSLIRLDLSEPRLRGQPPRGFPTQDEINRVDEALAPLLGLAVENPGRKVTLYIPAGIGEHRDHIAVATFGLRNRSALMNGVRLRFYEDLPYAATYAERPYNDEVRSVLSSLGFRRRLTAYVWEEKIELLKCYRSQLTGEPARREFSVAASGDVEAWWE